jgi:hypothetical protein
MLYLPLDRRFSSLTCSSPPAHATEGPCAPLKAHNSPHVICGYQFFLDDRSLKLLSGHKTGLLSQISHEISRISCDALKSYALSGIDYFSQRGGLLAYFLPSLYQNSLSDSIAAIGPVKFKLIARISLQRTGDVDEHKSCFISRIPDQLSSAFPRGSRLIQTSLDSRSELDNIIRNGLD